MINASCIFKFPHTYITGLDIRSTNIHCCVLFVTWYSVLYFFIMQNLVQWELLEVPLAEEKHYWMAENLWRYFSQKGRHSTCTLQSFIIHSSFRTKRTIIAFKKKRSEPVHCKHVQFGKFQIWELILILWWRVTCI